VTSTPVLAVSAARSNAELVRDCARLGYLTRSMHVLDPTYGRAGGFWRLWRPDHLVACDLDPTISPIGFSVDFTDLPWPCTFDAVALDGPYKLCLDDQTSVLTRRGWLTCDQVLVGDLAYSIDTETGLGDWQPITAVNVYPAEPTQVLVAAGRNLDFVATLGHRWWVRTAWGTNRWKTSAELVYGDTVPHCARWASQPTEETVADDFVKLVAWFWTEGTTAASSGTGNTTYGHIAQSHVVNPDNCEEIEASFRALFGAPSPTFDRTGRSSTPAWRIRDEERMRRFVFSAAVGSQFLSAAPGKVPSLEFLESLSARQLDMFIDVSLRADGQNMNVLAQSDPARSEAFALACLLAGRSISIADVPGNGRTVKIKRRDRSKIRAAQSEVRWTRVWCPTVAATGTWLARRNGRIYFTGNSGTGGSHPSDERYGITSDRHSWQARHALIAAGITEAARVLVPGGILLVKCQDQVCGGAVRFQTDEFTAAAAAAGCRKIDVLHLLGHRPQPEWQTCRPCKGTGLEKVRIHPVCQSCGGAGRFRPVQQHAARNHSTLLVFRKARR
jgi:hypothetical protein